MTSPDRPMLHLIDGHGQIFRAYFAIRGGMTSPVTGEPTNAVFAFAGMLLNLLLNIRPTNVVMVIDLKGPTFRDELYPAYKAQRPPVPDDFRPQEARIFELIGMMGLPMLGRSGVEADDVIATLARQAVQADYDVTVLSRDKDLEQLLSDRVSMLDLFKNERITPAWLWENKGIRPDQVIDYLTMTGDTSDNVPGVDGIGPKTAAQLLAEFGSLDQVMANLDRIKGKRRENLEKAKGHLPLTRQLVTLKSDVADCAFVPEQMTLQPPDAAALRRFFQQMGFRRHQAELERYLATWGMASSSATPSMDSSSESAKSAGLFAASSSPSSVETPLFTESPSTPDQGRDYRCVTTLDELRQAIDAMRASPIVALDTETIGLGPKAPICGISLAWQPGHAIYVPVRSADASKHLSVQQAVSQLKPLLEDEKIAKCGHHLKYDLRVLRQAGIRVRGVTFDSMIAAFLLSMPAKGLDDLALSLLNHRMQQITELIAPRDEQASLLADRPSTMDQVPLDQITVYAADDAEVSLRLCQAMRPMLEKQGLSHLADDLEMPLVEVLAEMEYAGIRLDPQVLDVQRLGMAERLEQLQKEICQAAEATFNIDSPKQLGQVLFEQMGLPVIRKTKTGPSTDAEVIETLLERDDLTPKQSGVLTRLLEYRRLAKLLNTYLQSLKQSIDPATGRVHTQYHQTGAITGRLSSSDPNLQNIPVRSEQGKQIRQAFIADQGKQLIVADYSQIELRLLAHLSQDQRLLEAFREDLDIHTAVASQVFAVPLDQVTSQQRAGAKVINFGIVYGVTAYGLARRVEGLNPAQAAVFIADYKKRYAGIDAFLDQCVQQAQSQGYVTTMLGRRRPIPEIQSSNGTQRALGQRLAINSVVQGSAADLIKLAMIHLQRRIDAERLPLAMLLQVHDELVLEAPAEPAQELSKIVRQEMEQAMTLSVPLKVDVGVAGNWLAAKESA